VAKAAGLKSTDWPYPVIELYLGRRSAADVLLVASKADERCEAQFYNGEWQLLRGNRAAAATALQAAAADICPKNLSEYKGALAELKRFETGLALIDKASAAVEDFPDFHLARGLFFMNLVRSNPAKYVSYLPKIESSFKRSLALGETEKYKSVRGSGTFLAQYNLGTLYHVFGNAAEARKCFEQAAASGYDPAKQMLQKLQGR